MTKTQQHLFAAIPSVDYLLQQAALKTLIADYGRDFIVQLLRSEIEQLRQQIRTGQVLDIALEKHIIEQLHNCVQSVMTPGLKTVFNLTGTVLHTNLGRALLPEVAVDAMTEIAVQASNLEFDLNKAKRGDRDDHVEDWLCRLTGAEAATVVNNNAAAVLLILNTLALAKEVPVSRGELVEIGGSFRMPDIMARAGCKLVEVGTTNRTHSKDFKQAINRETGLLLRVHTSNYEIQGFTASVSEAELAKIAHEHELALFHDLGSGSLLDLKRFGLGDETTAMASIQNGVDIVSFSGDKLLGGPQCGIIIGKRELIDEIKRNPMKRALRCDKMTLAALQALLPLYADPERACQHIPTLRLLTRTKADITATAQRLLPVLVAKLNDHATCMMIDCASQIGSGALPVAQLPSVALAIKTQPTYKTKKLSHLADAFRALPKPVLGRLHDDTLIFDLRCLEHKDEAAFIGQLNQLSL